VFIGRECGGWGGGGRRGEGGKIDGSMGLMECVKRAVFKTGIF